MGHLHWTSILLYTSFRVIFHSIVWVSSTGRTAAAGDAIRFASVVFMFTSNLFNSAIHPPVIPLLYYA